MTLHATDPCLVAVAAAEQQLKELGMDSISPQDSEALHKMLTRVRCCQARTPSLYQPFMGQEGLDPFCPFCLGVLSAALITSGPINPLPNLPSAAQNQGSVCYQDAPDGLGVGINKGQPLKF